MPAPALHEVNAASAKSGRTRYMRLFAERAYFLLDQLTERELSAWLRLSLAFVIADGDLADDDKRLASITKLSARAWSELRDKLLLLGLGRVEAGQWIDDDQLANLRIQRAVSERGKRGAQGRWGKARDAA
jgi:hypothetical protein